jgi:hypothetical protein
MRPALLLLDAAINLALGVLLILFPAPVVEWLGIPPAEPGFYRGVLGAVVFGIGVALLIEARRTTGAVGLGLGGAIAINLAGALAILGWVAFGGLELPTRGATVLVTLSLLVIGVAAAEMVSIRSSSACR